jgi:hypothetical protein
METSEAQKPELELPTLTLPTETSINSAFDYQAPEHIEHYNILTHARDAIRKETERCTKSIITIGWNLQHVKKECGHGLFLKWLDAEFGWSHRTAQRFMRAGAVLDTKENATRVSHLEPTAIHLLSAPSTPEQVREEVLTRFDVGEKISTEEIKSVIQQSKGAPAEKRQIDPVERVKSVIERLSTDQVKDIEDWLLGDRKYDRATIEGDSVPVVDVDLGPPPVAPNLIVSAPEPTNPRPEPPQQTPPGTTTTPQPDGVPHSLDKELREWIATFNSWSEDRQQIGLNLVANEESELRGFLEVKELHIVKLKEDIARLEQENHSLRERLISTPTKQPVSWPEILDAFQRLPFSEAHGIFTCWFSQFNVKRKDQILEDLHDAHPTAREELNVKPEQAANPDPEQLASVETPNEAAQVSEPVHLEVVPVEEPVTPKEVAEQAAAPEPVQAAPTPMKSREQTIAAFEKAGSMGLGNSQCERMHIDDDVIDALLAEGLLSEHDGRVRITQRRLSSAA